MKLQAAHLSGSTVIRVNRISLTSLLHDRAGQAARYVDEIASPDPEPFVPYSVGEQPVNAVD